MVLVFGNREDIGGEILVSTNRLLLAVKKDRIKTEILFCLIVLNMLPYLILEVEAKL